MFKEELKRRIEYLEQENLELKSRARFNTYKVTTPNGLPETILAQGFSISDIGIRFWVYPYEVVGHANINSIITKL